MKQLTVKELVKLLQKVPNPKATVWTNTNHKVVAVKLDRTEEVKIMIEENS